MVIPFIVPEKHQVVTRISSRYQKMKYLKFSEFLESGISALLVFFPKMNLQIL